MPNSIEDPRIQVARETLAEAAAASGTDAWTPHAVAYRHGALQTALRNVLAAYDELRAGGE